MYKSDTSLYLTIKNCLITTHGFCFLERILCIHIKLKSEKNLFQKIELYGACRFLVDSISYNFSFRYWQVLWDHIH